MSTRWRNFLAVNVARRRNSAIAMTLLAIASSSCHRDPSKVALLTPPTGEIVGGAVYTHAVVEGARCGLRIHFDTPPGEDDLRIQLAQFQQATEDHFDVIAIAPIQMRAFRDPIERASQKGIPIIVIGDDLGIRGPNIAYILTDEQMAGKLAADTIGDLLHGDGNVALMGIDFGKPANLIREQSFEQELSGRYKRIHLVQKMSGTTNVFQEQQSAADLLNSSKRVDAIVALSAPSSRGAFYAVKAKNARPPVRLIGFNQDLIIPLIYNDLDAVIGPKASDIGQTVARLACDRQNGTKWDGPYILSPYVLTPENVSASEGRH